MPQRRIDQIIWLLLILTAPLAGCGAEAPPTPAPLAPAPTLEPFGRPGEGQAAGPAPLLGYLLADGEGARLAGSLSFAGTQPQALGPAVGQVWCGPGDQALPAGMASAGPLRYALVLARGRLSGPGAYGPGGQYGWQLAGAEYRLVVPQETSVADLLARPGYFERRVVRVNGGLIAGSGTAMLVDLLGQGGVPEPGAQQVKLRMRADDALLAQLRSAPGGAVRFGTVQVEGYWSDGALNALAIRPVSA